MSRDEKEKVSQTQKLYQANSDVKAKDNALCGEIVSIDNKKTYAEKDRDRINCKKLDACIKNRHRLQKEVIIWDYETRREMMGRQPPEKPLQVFSVSSEVFNRFDQGDEDYRPRLGFQTKWDTYVPKLRDALISTTWDLREANARAFYNDAQTFLGRLRVWSSDISADYKMSAVDRAILESGIERQTSQAFKGMSFPTLARYIS